MEIELVVKEITLAADTDYGFGCKLSLERNEERPIKGLEPQTMTANTAWGTVYVADEVARNTKIGTKFVLREVVHAKAARG